MAQDVKQGVIYAGLSYVLWGILPIYWKLIGGVSAGETLANRVIWSFVFMLILLLFLGKLRTFMTVVKGLWQTKKQLFGLIIASLLVSANWFIFIWAVNNGQMIETSMGYYINPLISVLLGMVVFKERLSISQYVSFALAAIGVIILTVSYGSFPWVSFLLALSFALYGLAKKIVKVDAAIGLTLETMVITPIALLYMGSLFGQQKQMLFHGNVGLDLLLIGAGVATAVPLLLFANGVQRIPLSMVGFLQYIAPTIMLVLGVFVYGEYFSKAHFLSFLFIWISLTIYSLSRTKSVLLWESKIARGKQIGM